MGIFLQVTSDRLSPRRGAIIRDFLGTLTPYKGCARLVSSDSAEECRLDLAR